MKALIKIGGTLLDDPVSRGSIARQIAQAVRAGFTITVVHGGGKQMTRFLEERGIQSRFVRGLRVTTPETMDAVLKVLAGSVNTELVASLGTEGVRAVGLTGVDAGLAEADQLDPELGQVGREHRSDTRLLGTLADAGYVPVVACIAGGAGGAIFNVNGDSMAAAVAAGSHAERLLFLTDVAGVLDASKIVIPFLTVAACEALVDSGVATGGMQAKLDAACRAVAQGVQEVLIMKGSEPGIIEQALMGQDAGTKVVR